MGRYAGGNSGLGWYSGGDSGSNSGGNSSEYLCNEETLPRELLLATASNTFGGSNKDKNWNAACT